MYLIFKTWYNIPILFTRFLVGTYHIRKGDHIMRSVDSALAAGYRLFGMWLFQLYNLINKFDDIGQL